MANEIKIDTMDNLIHTLLFKVKAGHFDREHTATSTYENSEYGSKIVYAFKSCVGKNYKNLIQFFNDYNIKYNLIPLKKLGCFKFRTLDYTMDQWVVRDKTYYTKNYYGVGGSRWHNNYIIQIDFNDLYYN
jgi:hypothetical protein